MTLRHLINKKNTHNLLIVSTLKHDTIWTIVIKYTIKINNNVELGYRSCLHDVHFNDSVKHKYILINVCIDGR